MNINNPNKFLVFKRNTKLVSTDEFYNSYNFNISTNKQYLNYQKNMLVEKPTDKCCSRLKVAAFAPHADDIELGCGATLARLIEQNNAILYYYVFITRRRTLEGEEINGDGMLRLQNCKSSFKYLITGESELTEYEAGSDEFAVDMNGRQGRFKFFRNCSDKEFYLNKELLFKEIRKLQITELSDVDIVFVPTFNDVHHDHQTLADICSQVFRKQENLLYYVTNGSRTFPHKRFNPNIFIESSLAIKPDGIYKTIQKKTNDQSRVTYVDVKLKLLSFFQTEKNSLWFDKDSFLMRMRCNAYDAYMTTSFDKDKFCEAFEGVIRL